jgi:hypothetical protein
MGWVAAIRASAQIGETDLVESLTFRSLTVVSDNEVDLIFDVDDGDAVRFRFTVDDSAGLPVTNGPPEFQRAYRMVPGPGFPMWFEQAALAAWRAHREPLPAGRRLEQLNADVQEELERRWNADRPVDRQPDG